MTEIYSVPGAAPPDYRVGDGMFRDVGGKSFVLDAAEWAQVVVRLTTRVSKLEREKINLLAEVADLKAAAKRRRKRKR